MNKVIHPEIDNENLIKAAGRIVTLVDDKQQVKEAASSAVSQKLINENPPDKDHFMIHLIAMGDNETYGWNRNGDGWPKEANQKFHNTFVKEGHFFREHDNRDPAKRIGDTVASAHNGEMARIELIVHGHKKNAAEEYELAKEGKPLSFSMSARVPWDRCSCCGNKATKSANYCPHLKRNMNKWVPEFEKFAFAYNDLPTFFDISRVKNPADRIAHYLEYAFDEDMRKAASAAPPLIFSDVLAEAQGVNIPSVGIMDKSKASLLEKLAAHELFIQDVLDGKDMAQTAQMLFVKNAHNTVMGTDFTDEQISLLRTLEPGTMLRELTKRGAVLPFKAFCAYVDNSPLADIENSEAVKYACSQCMPTMFVDLGTAASSPDAEQMFDPASRFMAQSDLHNTDSVQKLMDDVASKHGLVDKPTVHQITKITIMKRASNDVENVTDATRIKGRLMTSLYGMYKLSFLQGLKDLDVSDPTDDLTMLRTVYHNRVQ